MNARAPRDAFRTAPPLMGNSDDTLRQQDNLIIALQAACVGIPSEDPVHASASRSLAQGESRGR